MRDHARRQELGAVASAALPRIWEEMERRGWNDADLAREIGADSGNVAKILYGERRPGRSLAGRIFARLGIGIELWDEPCRAKRRPHAQPSLRRTGT